MNSINICFTFDNNYAEHCAVTMASILKNKKPNYNIDFYLITDFIDENNKNKILEIKKYFSDFTLNFLTIDLNKLSKLKNITTHSHVNLSGCYRLFLTEILPIEAEKIIYLDCDIIVNKDLYDLFNTDLEENFLAGVKDIDYIFHNKRLTIGNYINSGVLLIDLKKWKTINIIEEIDENLLENKDSIYLADQDLINLIFENKIKIISDIYNYPKFKGVKKQKARYKELASEKAITHYMGSIKPWYNYAPFEDSLEYNKYIKFTGWQMKHKCKIFVLLRLIFSHIYRKEFRGKFIKYKIFHKTIFEKNR